MKMIAKIWLTLFFAALTVLTGQGLFAMYVGNYFHANRVAGVFVVLLIPVALTVLYRTGREVWLGSILLLLMVLQACNYAKSNQQVVVSEDCGMNWKKVNAGDAVPKSMGNYCFMKVVMPNYPMQGDSRFVTNLKERVRAFVHIDYDYSIIEPLAFIKQAKFLGKANTDADSDSAIGQAFEGAENMVIDKRIRDVSKSIFLAEDIVELDQAEAESRLLVESNKVLEPLGVHLNFITLTFDLDEQTRQAIDVSTAMKIYESKGIGELGKQVMVQRAGAARIAVDNKLPIQPAAE